MDLINFLHIVLYYYFIYFSVLLCILKSCDLTSGTLRIFFPRFTNTNSRFNKTQIPWYVGISKNLCFSNVCSVLKIPFYTLTHYSGPMASHSVMHQILSEHQSEAALSRVITWEIDTLETLCCCWQCIDVTV